MLKIYSIWPLLKPNRNPELMLKHTASDVQGYFLCYYIPSKQDTTPVSSLLLKFKNNESEQIINQFCAWAGSELLKEGIQIQTIVRALNNNETVPTHKTALDKLGFKLAEYLNADYNPGLLEKLRPTIPLKGIAFEKRKMEIERAYFFKKALSEKHSILVIDDVYTTGATTDEIIRSIKLDNPNVVIYIFTMGKTEFQPNKNEEITLPAFIYSNKQDYPEYFEDMAVQYYYSKLATD